MVRVSIGTGEDAHTDYFFYSNRASAQWRFASYSFSGSFLALREDAYGEIVTLRASDDARLSANGQFVHRAGLSQ